MTKTILGIDGMLCPMCEAHINDAVRRAFPVKKVSSSAVKKQCEILSEEPLDEQKLRDVIAPTGYTLLSIHSESYEKKGFSLFQKTRSG